jgi:hypothetical protein
MVDVPVLGFQKYWRQKLASLKSECHAIMNEYLEAASVVLSDIEILAEYTPTKAGEISVNSAEENRANFCKGLEGKPLFNALYGMYVVT